MATYVTDQLRIFCKFFYHLCSAAKVSKSRRGYMQTKPHPLDYLVVWSKYELASDSAFVTSERISSY